MTKVAIMAPTFLPWTGYFNMIYKSDIFIFLDNVKFKKRSWQQRNRIIEKSKNNYQWITVPVRSKGKYDQLICDVEIDYENKNYDKLFRTLELNYKSSRFFNDFSFEIKNALDKKNKYLIELNIILIEKICKFLNIKKKFILSSSLNINSKKSQLLYDLTNIVGGTEYISAPGSSIFFEDHNPFKDSSIKLSYHEYSCKEYHQQIKFFLSHCSIIDMIFNVGKSSENYLKYEKI